MIKIPVWLARNDRETLLSDMFMNLKGFRGRVNSN